MFAYCLTHLSLTSILWDICKQNSPRYDAADRSVPSGAIPLAYRSFIENEIKMKKKNTPDAPKNENGLIQMTRM